MKILGIDTSFDDTSVAIVEDGVKILSNRVLSQKNIHEKTGGVVPEIAARTHVERILPTLALALADAGLDISGVDAIAVTSGPGLTGSLMVGTSAGTTLAMFANKPLYEINHIWGHLYANFLGRELHKRAKEDIFPILILTVAGGHTDIVLVKDWFDFELVGSTRDDASGEAFDKCARIIGIADFMGGPLLSEYAGKGKYNEELVLPRGMQEKKHGFDFSFSGLKTATRLLVEKLSEKGSLSYQEKYDVAFALEESICEVLSKKLLDASHLYNSKMVFVTGGVSSNDKLKDRVVKLFAGEEFSDVYFPVSKKLSTDNAAMIAGAAYFLKDYIGTKEWTLAKPDFEAIRSFTSL